MLKRRLLNHGRAYLIDILASPSFLGSYLASASLLDTFISLRLKVVMEWFCVCAVDTHTLLAGWEDAGLKY